MAKEQMRKAFTIELEGIVQGVGFRPFVYRLATRSNLAGYISNYPGSVHIHVEGEEKDLSRFMDNFHRELPGGAQIVQMTRKPAIPSGLEHFTIEKSAGRGEHLFSIPPDLALCESCERELFDSSDRRYLYPFTNCTDCGPRFSIIASSPYDRKHTSMKAFALCDECENEYQSPLNRRYHAEPNACAKCGPSLRIWGEDGREVPCSDAISSASRAILEGKIVALKGLGGFHLAADATRDDVIVELRRRKARKGNPFAVMVRDLRMAETIVSLSPTDRRILSSRESPILVKGLKKGAPLSPQIAPGLSRAGIFLAYTPLHKLLLSSVNIPLVMTSGNVTEEPIVMGNLEARKRLGGIADCFLVHDRDIVQRSDDSVVMNVGGRVYPVRRARGFVPAPVVLKHPSPTVVGLGGDLKNTFTVIKERFAFLSQHMGDMSDPLSRSFYKDTLSFFTRFLEVKPEAFCRDLHPSYFTTSLSSQFEDAEVFSLQHHRAHIYSLMAESGFSGKGVGVSFDGTGYGEDGAIWGGEFFTINGMALKRRGSLSEFPLQGGDSTIRIPWKTALSFLYATFGLEGTREHSHDLLNGVPISDLETVLDAIHKGVGTISSSSCGRLFDGVSALSGISRYATYEGEAAMLLEARAGINRRGKGNLYPFRVEESGGILLVDWRGIIEGIVYDLKRKKDVSYLSSTFHDTLADIIVSLGSSLLEEAGGDTVLLSGGVFQNLYLLKRVTRLFREKKMKPIIHRAVPANDGGISLGQAFYAAHMVRKGA
jgi:hydrogenase maturation protein HypF